MSWMVYMVRCSDDTLYTGVTTDLERRVKEHNGLDTQKKGAKYTRVRRPVLLVYSESISNRSEACKRESAIKKLTRDQKIKLLESQRH